MKKSSKSLLDKLEEPFIKLIVDMDSKLPPIARWGPEFSTYQGREIAGGFWILLFFISITFLSALFLYNTPYLNYVLIFIVLGMLIAISIWTWRAYRIYFKNNDYLVLVLIALLTFIIDLQFHIGSNMVLILMITIFFVWKYFLSNK